MGGHRFALLDGIAQHRPMQGGPAGLSGGKLASWSTPLALRLNVLADTQEGIHIVVVPVGFQVG